MFSKEKLSTTIIIFSLFVLIGMSLKSSAQEKTEDLYRYIKKDGINVYFEAVYNMQGVLKDSLVKALISDLQQKQGVVNVKVSGDDITADLESWNFNYKKHGYKAGTVSMNYSNPFWGNIIVSVKDGKYKAVVKNIISNKKTKVETRLNGSSILDGAFDNIPLESSFLKLNSDKGWATRGDKIKVNKAFETELYELFIIKYKSDW